MNNTKEKTSVNYDQVAKAAIGMLSQGSKPSVRGIMQVTGGKTESVASYLRDFNNKRKAEVLTMADELGSSSIAKLLADEILTIVDRKTTHLQTLINEQEDQIDEYVELLNELESSCKHKVEQAESNATLAISDANKRAAIAESMIAEAQHEKDSAIKDKKQSFIDNNKHIENVKTQCEAQITSAKNEANLLVQEAQKRTDNAEAETKSLREQVKALSINEARIEIEQQQHEQAKENLVTLRSDLATAKTEVVKLTAIEELYQKDITRLESEATDTKVVGQNLAKAQGQLVELQKQVSQQQNDIASLQRERDSLSAALKSNQ